MLPAARYHLRTIEVKCMRVSFHSLYLFSLAALVNKHSIANCIDSLVRTQPIFAAYFQIVNAAHQSDLHLSPHTRMLPMICDACTTSTTLNFVFLSHTIKDDVTGLLQVRKSFWTGYSRRHHLWGKKTRIMQDSHRNYHKKKVSFFPQF